MNSGEHDGIWTEHFKVHSYEVDANQRATLETVCRYFQEAAWNHAEALGAGYGHLQKLNCLWVLSRLAVRIEALPSWGETLTVQTWPRAAKSVFAMRDFEIFNPSGARLIGGSSAWLVLNGGTRKPQRIDKLLSHLRPIAHRRAIPDDPEKLDLEAQSQAVPSREVSVRWSDLDVNGHVNYGKYIGWALDGFSAEFHRTRTVKGLEANYLGETAADETLVIAGQQLSSGESYYSLTKAEGIEVCRVKIWFTDSQHSRPGKTTSSP